MSESVSARGYRQVATALRARIESGAIPAGARLPTEASLVKEFGVARDTVRHAIALLAKDGLVITSHGRGTYVCGDSDQEAVLPKHVRVAAELRALIKSGEVHPEATFMTEAEVQERFFVSRRTARAALQRLEEDGLLYVVGRRRVVAGQDSG